MTAVRQQAGRVQPRPLPYSLLGWALVSLGSSICSSDVEVYKVVDGTGSVTYTDTPPAESSASKLELPSINQIPATEAGEPTEAEIAESVFAGYSRIEIAEPGNNSLIYYDQQQVTVRLALTPVLQEGHLVQFMLDGYPHGRPAPETGHTIDNLQRGSHNLQARVINAQGELVGRSRPVTIHVQRHLKRP